MNGLEERKEKVHSDFCAVPEECEDRTWIDEWRSDEHSERLLQNLAMIFKVLGDPTRLRILRVLLQGECCVCDIADTIAMEQSAVSHQLRVLRQAHVVDFRKEGKVAWYYLDDDHVVHLLEQGLEHARHQRR